MNPRIASIAGATSIVALAVGACGGDDPAPESSAGGLNPVSVKPPEAPVVSCQERIEFPDFEGDPYRRKRDYYRESLRIGPVALYPGREEHPNFERATAVTGTVPVDPIVPAGETVTLAVAPADQHRIRLSLHASDRGAAVTFEGCPRDQQRFSGEGRLGSLTAYREVFRFAEPGCATLHVYADGRRFERTVSFGVEDCPPSRSPRGHGGSVTSAARSAISVLPERARPSDSIRITFPTPYAIGDLTANAARVRTDVGPRTVEAYDNYHVIFSRVRGAGCDDRRSFRLGYGAEREARSSRTVTIKPGFGPRDDGVARWCPGRYRGHVEFRQPERSPGIPFERLGNFSFTVEAAGG